MGLFDKIFKSENKHSAPKVNQQTQTDTGQDSKKIIEVMIMTVGEAMRNEDYERAVDICKNILELEPNETAQYILGNLYAQGKGAGQDFMEAAYWFRQAELAGNEMAGKLCMKCMLDFTHQNFENKTSEILYTDMVRFVKYIYPEENAELKAGRNLFSIAGNHFNNKEYSQAAKIFRAAAQLGNDGYSQNYLAVLYNAGAGAKKNDLAALYWFDKAVDNGVETSRKDRDGILNAYKTNLTSAEFYEQMMILSGWCGVGSEDVPKDAAKAEYWRGIGESRVKETAQ